LEIWYIFPLHPLTFLTKNEKEVDATLKLAEDLGGRILKPAQKTFWGGYGRYFADHDGFLWEVAYNPFWKLDRKGNVKL
jgi:uncharacterized glyoxalase superfamily protein PhnB